ncbi:type IV secretory system conjugative DNA transfer family protein [Marinoscillum sp.]|uniref:type IV secretory system conjugative DNA transfer family protein n=1 Tax=Marinoscillum sp. TaxID=2024838 RepID=UPI003BAD948C
MNWEDYKLYVLVGSVFVFMAYLLIRWAKSSSNSVRVQQNKDTHLTKDREAEFLIGKSFKSDFRLETKDISKFCLLLGTTGAGKTVTIKNFYKAFKNLGFPIIYVDGKSSDDLIEFLHTESNGKIHGFNCLDHSSYDFLKGSPSEIKDRIICIKDQWESDYYKTLASDYLQITLKLLKEKDQKFTLETLLNLLNPSNLIKEARNSRSSLVEHIVNLTDSIKSSELKGIYNHLSMVIHSDFGDYITKHDSNVIVLEDIISRNESVYFKLPALKFPEFASFIGKVVINDIKSTIERVRKPVLLIFDEFSVFAGGQVLNLINQGREFGAHTIVGTQSLEDLKEWSDQILNNANLLICHRVHSNNTAESVSKYFGTRQSIQITQQLKEGQSLNVGSARNTREFHVHPDDLKSLKVGECFICQKDKSRIKKVQINYL